MTFFVILLSLMLFLIVFVIAPAFVFYHSIFSRRKVLPLDDERLYKPGIEPFKERMLSDLADLKKVGFKRVSIIAKDGVTLCADLYDRGADKTALMVHGYNADPYVNLVSPARWLYDNGFNLLVIYHRAHSYSGGDRSGMGLLEQDDVASWIEYLEDRDGSQQILLYGASMGGSALAYLSDRMTEDPVKGVMIDSGYISTERQLLHDVRRMHLPVLKLLIPLIGWICKRDIHVDIREKTTDHLKKAQKPILFFHTENDPTVDLSEGQENCNACSSRKQMVITKGEGHMTAFLSDESLVTNAMKDFIHQYFI